MRMDRDLIRRQRNALDAGLLAQRKGPAETRRSGMYRYTALEVRQGECRLTVTAIGRAYETEESVVLRDRQQLAVAEGPAGRRKVPGKDPYLTNVRVRHINSATGISR